MKEPLTETIVSDKPAFDYVLGKIFTDGALYYEFVTQAQWDNIWNRKLPADRVILQRHELKLQPTSNRRIYYGTCQDNGHSFIGLQSLINDGTLWEVSPNNLSEGFWLRD